MLPAKARRLFLCHTVFRLYRRYRFEKRMLVDRLLCRGLDFSAAIGYTFVEVGILLRASDSQRVHFSVSNFFILPFVVYRSFLPPTSIGSAFLRPQKSTRTEFLAIFVKAAYTVFGSKCTTSAARFFSWRYGALAFFSAHICSLRFRRELRVDILVRGGYIGIGR